MKIGLGTAQFGMDYGIANRTGIVKKEEIEKILSFLDSEKMFLIDTAPSYGRSEEVLGELTRNYNNFIFSTKTHPIKNQEINIDHRKFLRDNLYTSLEKLNRETLYSLLIHDSNDLYKKNFNFLVEEMHLLKSEGLIKKIGISVYSPKQIEYIISHYKYNNTNLFDLIQLPFNVFDQKLLNTNLLLELKKQKFEIHARSIFLQGLLLMDINEIPNSFEKYKNHIRKYQNFVKTKGLTLLESAVIFSSLNKNIDTIICGVENLNQLKEIFKGTNSTGLKIDNFKDFAIDDDKLINPSNW